METSKIIAELDAEIARLRQVRALLATTTDGATTKRKPGRPATTTAPARKKRVLSAEARARIAAAQKARWAKQRKAA